MEDNLKCKEEGFKIGDTVIFDCKGICSYSGNSGKKCVILDIDYSNYHPFKIGFKNGDIYYTRKEFLTLEHKTFKRGDIIISKKDGSKWEVIEQYKNCVKVIKNRLIFYFKAENFEIFKEELKPNENSNKGKIEYTNCLKNKFIVSYEIDKNNIKIKLENNPMDLITLCKVLLCESNLLNFKYERKAPFKIRKKYNQKKEQLELDILFFDIRNNNMNLIEKNILKLNKYGQLAVGEYNLFIPDLMEIMELMGLLNRKENGYVLNRTLGNIKARIKKFNEFSKENLENQGFIVPKGYKEKGVI